MSNGRPFRRQLDAGRLSIALARGNGCTCPVPETITQDQDGIFVVTVLHDDGCPLLGEHTHG